MAGPCLAPSIAARASACFEGRSGSPSPGTLGSHAQVGTPRSMGRLGRVRAGLWLRPKIGCLSPEPRPIQSGEEASSSMGSDCDTAPAGLPGDDTQTYRHGSADAQTRNGLGPSYIEARHHPISDHRGADWQNCRSAEPREHCFACLEPGPGRPIEKTAKNPILAVTGGNPRNHWWFSRVFHTVKSAKIRK
jgi:hypothetical protein